MSRLPAPVLWLAPLLVVIGAGFAARSSIPSASPPTPLISSSLESIACPSPDRCISVGLTGSSETVLVPLAAVLEDGTWTVGARRLRLTGGSAFPSSVACRSTTDCVAVGLREVPAPFFGARSAGDRPFAQVWDGRSWKPTAVPVPRGTTDAQFGGVACAASMCMAVGKRESRLQAADRALAATWDGERWAALPTATVPAQDEAALFDVACTSRRACTAVGQLGNELATVEKTVVRPLAERWDGTGWRLDRLPGFGSLHAVSCPSGDRCVAVGSFALRAGVAPLAQISDGGRWQRLATPTPPGSTNAGLVDVSCPRPDRCAAVGYVATGRRGRPLIESWDGGRWQIQPVLIPSTFTTSTLDSVDCAAASRCQAVGTYQSHGPRLHSFSATLADGRWTILPVPAT